MFNIYIRFFTELYNAYIVSCDIFVIFNTVILRWFVEIQALPSLSLLVHDIRQKEIFCSVLYMFKAIATSYVVLFYCLPTAGILRNFHSNASCFSLLWLYLPELGKRL